MLLVHNIPHLSHDALKPSVAAIGFFDGVHLGHHYLIEQVKAEAAKRGIGSSLITFPIHPRKVMDAAYKPELLTSSDEKIKLLEATGIDYCFALDFTSEVSHLTAYDFMRSILKERYKIQGLVIGYDHRFGHNRSEGYDDYCRYGEELGIDVIRAHARIINNVTISSSVIRRLLHAGDVSLASTYLGYEYFLDGTVIDGYKVGRTIGFPTANINVADPDKLTPADGVYAVRVTVNNNTYAGMLNIGHRPTINNGRSRSIEVHILHFQSDIYNCPIRISFVQRIRSEMKFTGKEQLVEQLSKDASVVKGILS